MKRKTIIYLATAVAIVLVITVWAYANDGTKVETVQARQGGIIRAVTDTGYVQAATNYDIHATQSARVVGVPVEVGQAVEQGQTLAVLENLDLAVQISDVNSQISQAASAAAGARAALERLQLELKDAQDNLARSQQLFQAGVISQVDFDKAKLQVDTARQNISEQNAILESALAQRAGLNQSLQQLSAKERQLTVKSPVNGIVLTLPVKQEQVVNQGTLLVNVAMSEQLEVKADILSDDLADIKIGQRVTVTAPVLGQQALVGEVKKIYPQAEEKTSALGVIQRRVPVIITLPAPVNLKPGYEVRVSIETMSRQDVLTLPRESVRTREDGQKEVMLVIEKRIKHQLVKTGISDQENVEISSGLTAEDQVVRDAGLNLAEKTRVK
ncbi:efflux RND transporter periplasmic adaptor subunit [Pelotomaculum propionicicum]|uniref:Macrolide export protein MacA n=1 Tax=Pelotomaculum propionicicum TaxID=258475 RepID=A0A4Y7RUA2_9FIRM|nr:efflux RND transporter periplasmic adaptor subunit [Pelotomaculum propionicicum]TEB12350.1 Macrolide export protein MacA [Pelotomaculum propionicicum]